MHFVKYLLKSNNKMLYNNFLAVVNTWPPQAHLILSWTSGGYISLFDVPCYSPGIFVSCPEIGRVVRIIKYFHQKSVYRLAQKSSSLPLYLNYSCFPPELHHSSVHSVWRQLSSCRQQQHSLVQKLFRQKLKKMMLLFLNSPPRCSQEHCCSSWSPKMLQTPWMTNFQNSSDWRLLQGSSM